MISFDSPTTYEQVGFPKPVDCSSCPSLCCRAGKILELSKVEVDELSIAGTDLAETDLTFKKRRKISKIANSVAVTIGLKSERANYILTSDCGNLAADGSGQSICADYENRPEVCGSFPVGELACRTSRLLSGIDTADEFKYWEKFNTAHA